MSVLRPLLALSLVLLPAVAAAEDAATSPDDRIVFTVTGFKNDKGSLRCGLFLEDSWLGRSMRSATSKIEDSRAVCEFVDVPAGTYGISSYHDKNGNGQLDLGFMRIPKEPYTTSNNARASFGPPKFENAKFTYESGLLELDAKMR